MSDMAFTVREFHDLVELLEQHPEWRAELRRLVLTEEVLSLPQIVRDLAEAQRRTEQRVAELAEAQRRTEQRVEELAEAQRRTEQRVEELAEAQRRTEQRVEELAEAQRRTEQRVEELAEAQRRTEQRVEELAEAQRRTEQRVEEFDRRTEQRFDRLEADVGRLKGMSLETRYRQRAFAYFSKLIRRTHIISGDELVTLLEDAVAHGTLSEADKDEVALADLIVHGRRRDDATEIYLVVEISWGIGTGDVERAAQRAALLAHMGVQTMPVVAGEFITAEAVELSQTKQVWQVINGQATSPHVDAP